MDIQKLKERAQEAARKKNFDYAVTLYHQILAVQPDNGIARAELRQILSKRMEYRKVSPLMTRILTLPQLLGILISRLSRTPDGSIRACERYLQIDPHNLAVNFMLGKSLEKAGYIHSAIAVYEYINTIDHSNTEALKRAGLLKYRNKDIQGALEYFEKVLAINPRDAEAEKMRKNLTAEGTLASGSYTTAQSSHELIKEKAEAAHLQRKERLHKTSDEIEAEIDHLETMLSEQPGDKRIQRELGGLLVRKKDFGAARKHYQQLLKEEPDSFDLKCELGDLEILEYAQRITDLEARLGTGGDPDLENEIDSLRNERLEKQAAEYRWRVEAHPTDLSLWFSYGQYAFKSGQVDEAIRAFQQAVKDPRHKVPSMHALGKLFLKKGLVDLATKQLEGALEAAGGVSGKSKAVVYDLGQAAEGRGDLQLALDWYLKIFEIDINYRDVALKIEQFKTS
ncbi:MAG: tetratricopeptide repeat protein [Planctomycetota bacterium]|jgi:tetratricopeptide (TPR) repeat protein